MESRTPRLLRLNHGIHQAISSPLAGSHSRLRLDEGVGRSRGSVGTLTSFNYAHAPLAEWPDPTESDCVPSVWGEFGPVMGKPPVFLAASPTTAAGPPHLSASHFINHYSTNTPPTISSIPLIYQGSNPYATIMETWKQCIRKSGPIMMWIMIRTRSPNCHQLIPIWIGTCWSLWIWIADVITSRVNRIGKLEFPQSWLRSIVIGSRSDQIREDNLFTRFENWHK